MANISSNKGLKNANKAKKDEFYTQLVDIEKELKHYRKHFKNKVVYCNCDDPRVSNFFHYFSYNFEKLSLKKLITTCYKNQEVDLFSQNNSEKAIYLEYEGDKNENHDRHVRSSYYPSRHITFSFQLWNFTSSCTSRKTRLPVHNNSSRNYWSFIRRFKQLSIWY